MRLLDRNELIAILNKPVFRLLSETADDQGVDCYVIGGFVRDLFLQRESKDIDVVVVGDGMAIAKAFCKRLGPGAKISLFKNFGTAQVKKGDIEIEFVGARKESYQSDSRKPFIENGTLEDDQNRRDFTINALAISLNSKSFGQLLDPFNGLEDLEERIIRTPLDPDVTFNDDPLRMMRCVRFATQLNFYIEELTFASLERNRERINIISKERISDELNKIISAPIPSKGFIELDRCGLLDLIFPELTSLQGVENINGRGHKDVFYHTLQVLDNVAIKSNDIWLRWAALLHDIGKPQVKKWDRQQGWTFHNHNYVGSKMVSTIFNNLKLPRNEKMRFVQKMVDLHMRPIAIVDDIVTDSAVRRLLFDAGNDIESLMLLCEADITSKNELRKRRILNNFSLVREKLKDLEERDRIRNFQPPIDGLEIMQTFNLGPNKVVGEIKNLIKEAVLDGIIPNEHDAAFGFMLQEAKKKGINPVENN